MQSRPYMAVMVTYALEPSTPNSASRDTAQGRRGVDWRAQVAEAEIPLFDALRDWWTERARCDGVAPYMVCTNQQIRVPGQSVTGRVARRSIRTVVLRS